MNSIGKENNIILTYDEFKEAMDNGFNAYMSKPINAGQLRPKITSILQRHVVFM